jgi:hypothetical protein
MNMVNYDPLTHIYSQNGSQEINMAKQSSSVPGGYFRKPWIIILVSILLLGVSACGGGNDTTAPTSTTQKGILQSEVQSTGIATTIPPTATAGMADPLDPLDVCLLITPAEAEAVMGIPVTNSNSSEDSDNIPGATIHSCTYLGNELAIAISVVDLFSPEAAAQSIQEQLVKMVKDDTSITTQQESGIGDQVYWSTNDHSGVFTVLKGNVVFSVLIGGKMSDPEAYKAGLRGLAVIVTDQY